MAIRKAINVILARNKHSVLKLIKYEHILMKKSE